MDGKIYTNRVLNKTLAGLVAVGLVLLCIAQFTIPYWLPCFVVSSSPQTQCWARKHLCPDRIPAGLCEEASGISLSNRFNFNEEIVVYLKYEERRYDELDEVWTVTMDGEVIARQASVVTAWWALTRDYCYGPILLAEFDTPSGKILCSRVECRDQKGKIVPLVWLSPKPECPQDKGANKN